jgi:hypothetical protein
LPCDAELETKAVDNAEETVAAAAELVQPKVASEVEIDMTSRTNEKLFSKLWGSCAVSQNFELEVSERVQIYIYILEGVKIVNKFSLKS